jgi:NADH:ubiquinone reductase (H+-translocating)
MPQPKIIIVGGGFGCLAAAKVLSNASAQILLIDRTNHHLFQLLLYRVAMAVLAPGQIGSPIREILKNQKITNAEVVSNQRQFSARLRFRTPSTEPSVSRGINC